MNEFKVGDLVYSPTEGIKVLKAIADHQQELYPIEVGAKGFTEYGMYLSDDHYPSIFHATKENQALLEALYGVKFDDPPLSGAERVIKALESSNGKPVLCWIKVLTNYWIMRDVVSYSEQHGFSLSGYHAGYKGYDEVKPVEPDEFVLA